MSDGTNGPHARRERPRPAAEAAPVTVRVPAKLNLYLGVGPLRADGYHEVSTVYQALSLYDEVTAEPAERLSVVVHGEGAAGVPRNNDNLAVQAARAVAALTGLKPAVRLVIRKGIPVAGGMAGGSADAAAALVACDALWGTGLDRETLRRLGSGLGSDVPFALTGGTALGTGRGEQLSPVLGRGSYHWVVGFAETGLSTPAVYAELDRLRAAHPAPTSETAEAVVSALRQSDPVALGRVLSNDLQDAALSLRPQLRRVLDTGRELGAVGSIVSGSGPTVAMLVRSPADGVALAAALSGSGVCRSVRQASSPVPGARILTG